jgi:hypothetical protein
MAISPQMKSRLDSIDKLIAEGYRVKKVWDAFPALESSNGVTKNVLASSPAGFSWIAFFFPFAVCAQIKEWSYFYVAGFIFLAGSILYKITGWDPSYSLGAIIGYLYGFYYPYLRWQAHQKGGEEFKVGTAILIGLLLSLVCALPSIVFETVFID